MTKTKPLRIREIEEAFLQIYVRTFSKQGAAREVGIKQNIIHVWPYQVLAKPAVQERLAELRAERTELLNITKEDVLAKYWEIATGNANELQQVWRLSCRHCYGIAFHYQWRDEMEFEEARTRAQLAGKDSDHMPLCSGGFGFNPTRKPFPDCPKCNGVGEEFLYNADTRFLSPVAQSLYAGAKAGKEGIEIKMHDRMKALDKVADLLGFTAKQGEDDDNNMTVVIHGGFKEGPVKRHESTLPPEDDLPET